MEASQADIEREAIYQLARRLRPEVIGFEQVVKVTVYLLRIEDRAAVNTVRRKFFEESRPASTLVEVSAFVMPGALLEIDAVAKLPS